MDTFLKIGCWSLVALGIFTKDTVPITVAIFIWIADDLGNKEK